MRRLQLYFMQGNLKMIEDTLQRHLVFQKWQHMAFNWFHVSSVSLEETSPFRIKSNISQWTDSFLTIISYYLLTFMNQKFKSLQLVINQSIIWWNFIESIKVPRRVFLHWSLWECCMNFFFSHRPLMWRHHFVIKKKKKKIFFVIFLYVSCYRNNASSFTACIHSLTLMINCSYLWSLSL